MPNTFARTAAIAALLAGAASGALAQEDNGSILVQSTTSTANSGLYDYLLPLFEDETGITVNVVAVGTGQAIENARNCDGDVLLVHAKPAEEKFVEDGFGTERTDLMYNDFVIVGPEADPAGLDGMAVVEDALALLAERSATFASRGDDSGTHKKELSLWSEAGIDPAAGSGDWYRETGSGMGATLNAAIGMGAYTMTDRATWISFENKQDYEIFVEGDDALFNQYGVIPVSPEACPSVNAEGAQTFADWLLSAEGQTAIGDFVVDGQQLFFPNAPEDDTAS
ncbi:sulfate/tungstate ABC transporter periplasmic substrate-binding protein [Roseivivax marinus]|uniref:Sulfate/tungstate ABC transporter periplasmic substrate-binding protein n=1 Tax=Roseivivax marinus TaxID=1379903 RepID=W4HG53_9RHOB|nr:substrate-binding domain-containing protein [Roseivivax marinus]ETW11747.1 sulfate/tungstate ABC transporter periplasmic substrate-binding protein [Roseivivax marinus]